MLKNKILLLLLIIMASTNSIFAQRTFIDFEKYLFEPLFQLCIEDNIDQIIEEKDSSEVIRKWIFNKQGRLSKEFDWRVSGYSSSMGFSSTTNYHEYIYDYLPNGKIKQIIEKKVTDGDTSLMTHQFEYVSDEEIRESFKINQESNLDLEFIILSKFKNDLLDTKISKFIKHFGDVSVESKFWDYYEYNEEKNLIKKSDYYSAGSLSSEFEIEAIPKQIGVVTNYSYNKLGEIHEIIAHEFDENNETKLHRKIQFSYKENSSKISNIEITNGEYITPRNLSYNIKYDNSGKIYSIKVNNDSFYFQYKKNRK